MPVRKQRRCAAKRNAVSCSRFREHPVLIFAGLCLIATLAGCYGPMYAQPTYPGVPGGTQYYPGGTVAPGGGTILGPGTPTYDGSAAPGNGGSDAPFYGSGSGSGSASRLVPDEGYGDAGNDPFYSPNTSTPSSSSAGSTSTGATSAGGASGQSSSTPSEMFDWNQPATNSAPASGNSGNSLELDSGENFEQPLNMEPISYEREVRSAAALPYAHDQNGHAWLQGVVSRDPNDGSWGIVYSVDPAPTDTYAGFITLGANPSLSGLRDGDVVRVEGRVDPSRPDGFGRATYAVSRLTPLR